MHRLLTLAALLTAPAVARGQCVFICYTPPTFYVWSGCRLDTCLTVHTSVGAPAGVVSSYVVTTDLTFARGTPLALGAGVLRFSLQSGGTVDLPYAAVPVGRTDPLFAGTTFRLTDGFAPTALTFGPAVDIDGTVTMPDGPTPFALTLAAGELAPLTTTPEPASVVLLAAGLGGAAFITRRRLAR